MLLVEDDRISAMALSTILRRRGFEVSHASTVADALACLGLNPVFVILDLMLPDGDGLTVLKTIRQTGRASRVFVTTAVSEPDRLRAVHALKPDLVLQKPIDLSALFNSLKPFH